MDLFTYKVCLTGNACFIGILNFHHRSEFCLQAEMNLSLKTDRTIISGLGVISDNTTIIYHLPRRGQHKSDLITK